MGEDVRVKVVRDGRTLRDDEWKDGALDDETAYNFSFNKITDLYSSGYGKKKKENEGNVLKRKEMFIRFYSEDSYVPLL